VGRDQHASFRLTRRGLVLVLILFGLSVMTVYPLRQYISQQQRIDDLESRQAAVSAEVQRLERERERLRDPEYVEQLAREELHMARPGDEAWALTGEPPPDPQPPEPDEPPEQPWYQRVLDWLLGREG
jgi:cell division protein FtsL